MHMNGPADGAPTKLPVTLMDVLAAHQLKESLLTALLNRERNGGDAYVPVSLIQAAVSGLANQATNWLVAGHSPQRMGSAHPSIAPYGTPYPTADGSSIVFAVGTDHQFATLCDVLNRSDLSDHPDSSTNARRVEHREALDDILEARIAEFEADALLATLHERTVPAGMVRDVSTVLGQPTSEAMILSLEGGLKGLRQTAFPHPDGEYSSLASPPHYAEYTTTALRDHLDLSADHIDALGRDDVFA
jgi:crotonobetainyl-CoA:carnitine CoA-transferase CaiB-like acyl-CoA transferase